MSRLHDAQTIEIARRVLRLDSNVIDVGANRGVILKGLIAIAPAGDHIAVEPLPRHAKALARRFPAVTVHQAALSHTAGRARFRRVIGASEHSSLDGIGHDADGKAIEYFEVTLKTLDDIAPPEVAFLKVDAEGAEYDILRGGSRVLTRRPYIAFELGINHAPVWELLTHAGYYISTPARWLAGESPAQSFDDLRGEWFFLAYPADRGRA